jgi:precorrin-4 methylase
MPDEIIDAAFAHEIQARARQTWPIVGWCVTADIAHQRGKYVARLLAGEPSRYVLIADTLDELHASLPSGLTRLPGLPADQPAVVELWFAA